MTIRTGDLVGAHRWPYSHAHPDCWLEPLRGVVLDLDDPRAWKGSIAFSGHKRLTRKLVSAHVEWCRAQGLLTDTVPVLWTLATLDEVKVFWETKDSLVSVEADRAAWIEAREENRARWSAGKAA